MGDVERCHISRLCFLCWVFGGALVGKSYMGDVERCHISRLCFLCWVFGGALVGGRSKTVLCTVVDWRRVASPSFRAFASFYSSI